MSKTVKKGFLGSLEKYTEIMSDLLKKNFSNIYFLCGDEPFFVDKICNYISDNTLEESEKSFNQFNLYGSEINVMELSDVCRQYPMGAKRSVVIVREGQSISSLDTFVNYVNNPLQSTIVVICYSGTLNKTQKLYKAIAKHGVYFESTTPRDYEIQAWLVNHIRSKGYTIDAVSVSLLVESVGTSIIKIDNELNKLINFIPEDRKVITSTDIENNIGISKDFNNFELTRALSEYNIVKALQIADYFGNNPQRNPVQLSIVAIFNHFTRIFKLGLIYWEAKQKNTQIPQDSEVAMTLQIGSTYFLKEYKQALQYYPLKKLFIIFELIRQYEMKSKGVDTGSVSTGSLLKELICKITSL